MGRTGWAGTTLADRRADRRRRLLDTGLELLGTRGSAAVTVRSVCRAAQLTDRYFYESFSDREALVLAVYDEVAAHAGRVLVTAVAEAGGDDAEHLARSAVDAFLDMITGDPRRGRVLLLEPLADRTLGRRSVALSPAFARIIRDNLAGLDEAKAQLAAAAVFGAMANLLVRWLDGSLPVPRAELADYCVALIVAAVGPFGPVTRRSSGGGPARR